MKAPLSMKAYEDFSAYLDGQLSPSETRRLEELLQSDPEQRARLDELAATRNLLRSAPRYRAPRNFTISPEMARKYARRSIFPALPVFRFSAALAALSLIAVFVLELSGPFSTPTVMNVAMAPAAAQKSAETQSDQGEARPTMVIQWGSSNPNQGGSGGGAPDSQQALGKGGGMGGGSGETPNPLSGPVALPPNAAQSLQEEAPSLAPNSPSRSASPEIQGQNPILGLPAQSDGGKLISPNGELQDLPEAAVIQSPQESPSPTPSWLTSRRTIELAIIFLALAAGLVALYFRRKAA